MESTATAPTWFRWLLRGLVVLPIAVAAGRAIANGWFPVGDSALLAVRAYDVGTEHHPLLGSWTSASVTLGVDVNNPGPSYPDLLAPFMWTLGRWFGIGTAVAVGVATVNSAAALGTATVGHRLGGWRVERWCLLLVAALSWSMGSELLIDIWQPHALLLPFACLLMLTVGLADGDWGFAPWWLGVASLIVQTHIGYVYVVAVLGLLVFGLGVARLRRDDFAVGQVAQSRTAWASVVVVGLVWLQPLIEQFFGQDQGNLARLASNAGGGDITIGVRTAVKLVAQVVVVPPFWTRYGFEDAVTSTPLTDGPDGPVLSVSGLPSGPIAVLLVVVVFSLLVWISVVLRRRAVVPVDSDDGGDAVPPDGGSAAASAALVAAVGVAAGVVTLTVQTVSVVGLGAHHVRWLFVVSLFVQVTLLWAIVELGAFKRLPAVADYLAPVLIVGLVGVNLGFHAHDDGPTADRDAADTLEGTFADLDGFEPGGAVRYDVETLRPFEPWSSSVQMRMRELGVEFRVADDVAVRQLGNRRRVDGGEATTIRQVERGAALGFDGPGCVISRSSPHDSSETAEVDALIEAAVADVASGRIGIDAGGLGDDLPRRFEAATNGDEAEARVLVSDGLLPFLASEGRLTGSSPAIEAMVANADIVASRVEGTLLLVADPPVGCLDDR